jgi:hypothetical protein
VSLRAGASPIRRNSAVKTAAGGYLGVLLPSPKSVQQRSLTPRRAMGNNMQVLPPPYRHKTPGTSTPSVPVHMVGGSQGSSLTLSPAGPSSECPGGLDVRWQVGRATSSRCLAQSSSTNRISSNSFGMQVPVHEVLASARHSSRPSRGTPQRSSS